MNRLIEIITAAQDHVRDRSLDEACLQLNDDDLIKETNSLDLFWRDADNLYQRVRALLFLSTIHRYHLPIRLSSDATSLIPFDAYRHFLERRFQEAIDRLVDVQQRSGTSLAVSSGLAASYRELAFQTLADQVRRSVRNVRGNQWMFRLGHPLDHPLRLRNELRTRTSPNASFPVLSEKTAVRMDFSHSGWSDIFFLGMDFPDGARVVNASIDLGVRGRDAQPRPPIETYFRVIDRPIIRLVSVDLNAVTEITTIPEMFDFGRDYLGLVKAAIIAAGLLPPGMEGCQEPISSVLDPLIGEGLGFELVSKVNSIPKGSRLAVSTNLLGSLISICMRATSQVNQLTGGLAERDRRIVAARAILGEWLGGSGGGWQDSGGVWPGIKLIHGEQAKEGDPEFGISRGRLLPSHQVFDDQEISHKTREELQNSLVLVHGGMAQNVGPVLEMVTEKYLLRSSDEWVARKKAMNLLDEILESLRQGDIQAVGRATTENFQGPLQTIIPWCTNLFTNQMIDQSKATFGDDFWGFWMLGGMAGGGMGFLFSPDVQEKAKDWMQSTLSETKQQLESSLPFAMEPVVYDFQLNDKGSWAELREDVSQIPMPVEYYSLMVPRWLRIEPRDRSPMTQSELESLGTNQVDGNDDQGLGQSLLRRLLPHQQESDSTTQSLDSLLAKNGFDAQLHNSIRDDLRSGRIGLAQNRLPSTTKIEDVLDSDFFDARKDVESSYVDSGKASLAKGEVAVVTLAAGVGSRWTEGAGVVKALHPFCRFSGQHRRFIDVHIAKTRKTSQEQSETASHVFTTGYMTSDPIEQYLIDRNNQASESILVSKGMSVGLRMIPTVRDLLFAWEEMPQQVLDEQQQKVRASVRSALMDWARAMGEASDYTENVPMQCMHPVGHWYEIPNMLRNGTLSDLIDRQPNLKYLMLHNVDTLGANLDPGLLGVHIASRSALSFEVINRRLDDRGGGLARVNERVRLVEGLAMPREEDEFSLRFYNSMTTWISIDPLLKFFNLTRTDLKNAAIVEENIRRVSQRLPTYMTIKDVKKRWGHGQEDVFPVTQFEKLWGDMTAIPELNCQFIAVPLFRGQQLKEQAQLDGWLRDGSAAYVDSLCAWT